MSLISVIVPIYNAEKFLKQCIDSIINQTYKNLEIILVNDGSTDDSLNICEQYQSLDSRIIVVNQLNNGVSSARNAGLNICSGDYIGFVDSDDWIAPSMYEDLIRACKDNGIVATIGSDQVTEDGKITSKRVFSDCVISAEEFLRNILCRKDGCSVWSRLFPRDVIGHNRFNESKLNEEILFWMSIMPQIRGVCYTSAVGYYYFHRSGSLSRHFGKTVHDMVENAIEMRKYVDKEFPSLSKEAERFEIFQHMSFLLCCPSNYDRKSDPLYGKVLTYIKNHRVVGIRNPYLTNKDKMKLLGVSFFPRGMSILVEKKSKRANKIYEKQRF